jgi:hypothetical protein
MGKSQVVEEKQDLIPTKAALFGLDVRFRGVDQKLADEVEERNALKRRCKTGNAGGERVTRHKMPIKAQYLGKAGDKKPILSHLIKSSQEPFCRVRVTSQGNRAIKFEKMKEYNSVKEMTTMD